MKVLIVDGSKESRRAMVDVLGQLTNVVILGAVANVRTALHALADAPPDVVVAGAELPDGDGAHLVERIRRLAHVPSIVVISGEPSEEQRHRFIAAGVDRYVERDDNLQSLQDAVLALGRGKAAIPVGDTLRLLGRMTAGVVHDLNNYLTAIEGTVTLLQRKPTDEALWLQMRRALGATARLNSTLLAYARGAPPEPKPLDFGALVNDVLAGCARLVPAAVRVTVDIASNIQPVRGVSSELEQLVLNLILNACDAMPDGGVLHIAVTTASPAVLLRVADSGHGIDLTKAYERNPQSLGLGIVRAVINRHHGALHFAPRTGGGTIVDVMLPSVA